MKEEERRKKGREEQWGDEWCKSREGKSKNNEEKRWTEMKKEIDTITQEMNDDNINEQQKEQKNKKNKQMNERKKARIKKKKKTHSSVNGCEGR